MDSSLPIETMDAVVAMDDDSFQTDSLRTTQYQMRNHRNSTMRGSTFGTQSVHAVRKSHQFTSRQRSSFLGGAMQDSTMMGRFDESTPDMMRTSASHRQSSANIFASMHDMDISLVEESPHRRRSSNSYGATIIEEGDETQGEEDQGVIGYVGDTVASVWNSVDAMFWDGLNTVGATTVFGSGDSHKLDDSRGRRRSSYESFGLAQIGEEDVLGNPQDNSFNRLEDAPGPFDTFNRNMSVISKRLSNVSMVSFEDDGSDYDDNHHGHGHDDSEHGYGVWDYVPELPDLGVSEWVAERSHILSHNVNVIQEEMHEQAEYVADTLGQTIHGGLGTLHGGLDTLGMTIHRGPSQSTRQLHRSLSDLELEVEKSILAKNVEYISDSLGKTVHGSSPAPAPAQDQQQSAELDPLEDRLLEEDEEEEKSILEKNVEYLQRQGAFIAHDIGNAFTSKQDQKWHQSNSELYLSL